jgi:hypothetical protein
MTEHDMTWFRALRNPMILIGLTVNLATNVWDYRATRACIANHRCKVGNPLLGQSRDQEISVGISLNAIVWFSAAKMKQEGRGNLALAILSAGAFSHAYEALRAQSMRR